MKRKHASSQTHTFLSRPPSPLMSIHSPSAMISVAGLRCAWFLGTAAYCWNRRRSFCCFCGRAWIRWEIGGSDEPFVLDGTNRLKESISGRHARDSINHRTFYIDRLALIPITLVWKTSIESRREKEHSSSLGYSTLRLPKNNGRLAMATTATSIDAIDRLTTQFPHPTPTQGRPTPQRTQSVSFTDRLNDPMLTI